MSCPTCDAPTGPGDRFCARCGAALDQRCETCGTVLPEEARFCPSCGNPVAPAEVEDRGGSGEERKVVSALFADLAGFTASSDGADPEDVRRTLNPYHTAFRDEVERFGGRIEKLMGDGVLAVFGAPVVHEDDAERAVRAGLAIQGRIEGLAASTGLRARVAIATGEAMVSVDGTTMDREGLVGDVVNTASRLQGEAEPGTVLVDETTHRATVRAFEYEERPPVAVRGKGDPLSVWVALTPIGRFGTDAEEDDPPLAGRSSELALLVEAFTRVAADRTSQLVTIAGEPGVGKSRLVRELLRHIDTLPDLIRWRQGRNLPYGDRVAFWALGEVVKAEAGILETDGPGTAVGKLGGSLEPLIPDPEERRWVARRLAPLVGSDQEAAVDAAERTAAWHRYLAALGEQRPTVIVIEDLHWADPNLVEFLSEVPETTRGMPLLLLTTARPDFFESHPAWGAGQHNALTIRLEPLDPEAARQLLTDLLEDLELDDETRRMVTDRSGGNPLWAQEFVRMLRDRPADAGQLPIPETVQALVAARVDLLDTETKSVVQAAATIGKTFWPGAVAELVPAAASLDESLRELTRRTLIRRERASTVAGETEFSFTHSLIRDVAYGQAPRAVRADRHHRVARWIERMAGDRVADRAEVIAHHDAEALRAAIATDMADTTALVEAAVESHVRAAEKAGRLDLNARRSHLEAALELLPPGDPRRGRLLLDLGDTHADLGHVDSAGKLLLEAREELDAVGDVEGWGLASSLLGTLHWVSGDPVAAESVIGEAITRLEEHPPGPALATAYSQSAGRLWLRGDSVDEALELIDRVRPIVEVHGGIEARRRLLSAEGGTRFDTGDPAAIELFRQVLRMAIESDESQPIGSGYLNLGEELRTGWGTKEAIPVHERGLEIAVQRHTLGVEQFIRASVAIDYFLSCRWDDAIDQLDAGLAMPARLAYLEGGFLGPKIVIQACRGEAPADAIEQEERLLAETETMTDLQAVIPGHEGAMWTHWMVGEESGAIDHARKIVERSGATRFLIDAFPLTALLLRRAGELGRIAALLEDLRRFDMPRPRALVQFAEALLAEPEDPKRAIKMIEDSADRLQDLGVVLEAAIALSEASRIARAAQDAEAAARTAERARGLLAGIRSEPLQARLGLG